MNAAVVDDIDIEIDIDIDDIGIDDIDVDLIVSDDEEVDDEVADDEVVERVPKRYIRDGHDPFYFYSDAEFKRRFRFNKESVKYGILPEIEEHLVKVNNRGLPIAPVLQLLICLRFYSTASFQLLLGDVITVSQPTVSRIVFRVSVLLASLLGRYITMPRTQEARLENQRLFQQLGFGNGAIGIPGVDGAIDCTHVRLVDTRFQEINEDFRNPKGYFSLNVQAVVGPRLEFMDFVPEWPGSAHDSRIFQNSRIRMRYVERQLTGILVGDAGYPCLPFLMTPLQNRQTDDELAYNNIHSRTRIVVERAFGVWKQRFPCLSRGLRTKLLCSTSIVVACAVLHNMALKFNDILPEVEHDGVQEDEDVPVHPPDHQSRDGFAVREALIARMFN